MPRHVWLAVVLSIGLLGCGKTTLSGRATPSSAEDSGSGAIGASSGGACESCDASVGRSSGGALGGAGGSGGGGGTATSGAGGTSSTGGTSNWGDADAARPVDAGGPQDGGSQRDYTPPVFAGLVSVEIAPRPWVTEGSITRRSDATIARFTWQPATDNRTPESDLRYRIYGSKVSGLQDFSSPLAESAPGATTMDVEHLDSNSTYYFVARAVDNDGNLGGDAVELSLATLVSFENDVQPMLTRTCAISVCHTVGADGTNPPIQGMDLDPGFSLSNILNVVAREGFSMGRPNMRRIDTRTGNPMDSYLWLTMIDDPSIFGIVMPPPVVTLSGVTVAADELDALRRWIIESKDTFLLPGCDAAPLDRPPGLECPTAAQPVMNGDFESGADHWSNPSGRTIEVVEDRPGNHALRLSNATSESYSAYGCTEVFVAERGMALRASMHGDPGAGVWGFIGSAPTDGSTAELSVCLNELPGYYMHICFMIDPSYSVPPVSVFVDDIHVVSDPSCP